MLLFSYPPVKTCVWGAQKNRLIETVLLSTHNICEVGAVIPVKPSSKIFYWPFQGGTSFVDLLCFCPVLCLLCLCARLFICALWSPAGKGLTSWLSFVVSTVSLSLSHWYPGSGVVLDCIDSWSLHPYLLCLRNQKNNFQIRTLIWRPDSV